MQSSGTELPKFEDIKDAAEIISGRLNRTPLDRSRTFSEKYGSEVYLKMENIQRTGSFKTRGALVRMSRLTQEERQRGVIAVSAGNHAQGVAYAARESGIRARIIMPLYTTPAKVNAVQSYGAEITLYGKDYNEAREYSLGVAEKEGMVFIDGFDDRWVVAGQGTIGLEIMEDLPDVDTIIVPVGGGGLISGIALAAKTINPRVRIIGVQSEKYDSMKKSVEAGIITPSVSGETIADGIAIKFPGRIPFELVKKHVDSIVTVSDESMALAIFKLLERHKTLAEPAGAAGLAALLEGKIDVRGRKTVIVVSGGNANLLTLSKIIYKSMELEWKLIRIDTKIPDRPGTLYRIASAISEAGGNIYHAEVDNLNEDTPVGYQSVTFSVNVRGQEHVKLLMENLNRLGYRFTIMNAQVKD